MTDGRIGKAVVIEFILYERSDTTSFKCCCGDTSQSGDEFIKACKTRIAGKSFYKSRKDLLGNDGDLECAEDVIKEHIGNRASQRFGVHIDKLLPRYILH